MLNMDEIKEILVGYHQRHGDSDITYAGTVETEADTLYLMRVTNMGGAPYSILDEIVEVNGVEPNIREVFSNPRRWEKSMIRFAKATARVRRDKLDEAGRELYDSLWKYRKVLTRQQMRTLKGQIFAGDTEGARRGLTQLTRRNK